MLQTKKGNITYHQKPFTVPFTVQPLIFSATNNTSVQAQHFTVHR